MPQTKKRGKISSLEREINDDYENMVIMPAMSEHRLAKLMPSLRAPEGCEWAIAQQHLRDTHRQLAVDLTDDKRPMAIDIKGEKKKGVTKAKAYKDFTIQSFLDHTRQNLTAECITRRPELLSVNTHLKEVPVKITPPSGIMRHGHVD